MTSESRRPLVTGFLIALVWAGVHAGHAALPSLFDPLAAQVTDRMFALRARLGTEQPDERVAHLFIDDRTTRELGFYIERPVYAQVVRNLGKAEVAAQFHDSVFAQPRGAEEDAALADATRAAGRVFYGTAAGVAGTQDGGAGAGRERSDEAAGGCAALADESRALCAANLWYPRIEGDVASFPFAARVIPTFPTLGEAAAGLGFLDVVVDRDGIYRRAPLLVRGGSAGGLMPSLALRVAAHVLDVDPSRIVVRPGKSITLTGALVPGESARRDIAIPIDRAGRIVVNYLAPWAQMKNYSFSAVYHASDDRFALADLRDELSGRILIVSEVATGTGDIGPVPIDPLFPRSGIHAAVIDSILTGRFLHQLSAGEQALWVEAPLCLFVFVAAVRRRALGMLAWVGVLVVAWHVVAVGLFMQAGVLVDVPRPVFLLIFSALGLAAFQYHLESRARAVLRSTFDAYFPPAIVDKVIADPARLTATAQKKELTILFSDIAGFTPATELMDAGLVRDVLNEYFEAMIEIVFRHEGTLDKLIGDGLMAFFGDPQDQPDHAARAIRAAVEMQAAARRLDAAWRARGFGMPLSIRVGLNTGEVVVGNIGSSRRIAYTALGEPVNVAARLESNAGPGGVLLSARTRELAGELVPMRRLAPIQVKGIARPIEVFAIDAPVLEAADGPPAAETRAASPAAEPRAVSPAAEPRAASPPAAAPPGLASTPLPSVETRHD